MISKAKLYTRLDALEAELLELIVPHLQDAANGSNDFIFCVKQFNPFREFKNSTDKITEELVEIGSAVIALREKLDEPTQGILAERICWYCRKWSSADKYHKGSGTELAKKFLAEVESNEVSR